MSFDDTSGSATSTACSRYDRQGVLLEAPAAKGRAAA
jgi:hypothetical protein